MNKQQWVRASKEQIKLFIQRELEPFPVSIQHAILMDICASSDELLEELKQNARN